ncbi:MAG TPA: HAMP domain-containing protein, partial [Polyangiaceae bacterium]
MDPSVQSSEQEPGRRDETPSTPPQEWQHGVDQHERDERLRSLRDALRALRQGDFSVRLPTNGGAGDPLFSEVALAFNTVAEENDALARELARVTRAIRVEGRLEERASLGPCGGEWCAEVEAINSLITAMALPAAEAVRVLELLGEGDLSHEMPPHLGDQPLNGELKRLGAAVNALARRLRTVADGVSRVVREIGSEGKLGVQAGLGGLSGTWKTLLDDVNLLSGNLTAQVRNIALVSTAIANGDLSQKITVEAKGEILELKETINGMVEHLRGFAAEVTRVARDVGTEGRLGGRAQVPGVAGTWKDLTDNVNLMATNLTNQVRGIANVVTAVAGGDLSKKFVVEAKGEIAALADTINGMTDSLRTFADQVTTVAREVGMDGKLGGQAQVPGVAGTWRELTDNVNMLARNLTNQVRNIALVTTAVANGDLSQKISVDAKGELLALKDTVNGMVDQLRTFAREVTRVAREVGTDGQLGGQAKVPGVAGTWQELTESVNVMASNLTSQVRGIAKVVTAVATGDLGQKLVLDARGETAALAY